MGQKVWLLVFVAVLSTKANFLECFPFNRSGLNYQDISGVIQDDDLTYVGSVEGKWFFVEMNLKDWVGASNFCKERNMELATVTSVSQKELLGNSTLKGQDCVWTAAKESKEISMVTWENGMHPVASTFDYFAAIYSGEIPLLCGSLFFHPNGTLGFDLSLCRRPCKTLCQIVVEKKIENSYE